MRSLRAESVFCAGIFIVILFTIIQIINFDDKLLLREQRKARRYSSYKVHTKHSEVKNILIQPEITIGYILLRDFQFGNSKDWIIKILFSRTFKALRGTCFSSENGDVPYVYDRNKKERFHDIQKALIQLNLDQSTSVNDDTLAELAGWDMEFVMNWN